jgi:Cohesin domain
MWHLVRLALSTVLLYLFSAAIALGASVSLTPLGNGVFIIYGNQMDGIAGIDLIANYDTSLLAAPKIDQGSFISEGAMFIANPTSTPDTIKIIIIKANSFSGSGQIATISFASHTGTGNIAITTSMIDSSGTPVPGGGSLTASDFQTATPTTTPTAITNTSGSTTGAGDLTPKYLGTVSMPVDNPAKGDTKPADAIVMPAPPSETVPPLPAEPLPIENPSPETVKSEEIKLITYTGVIERFRSYKGEKTPASLISLFRQEIAPRIHQEPLVALSDGITVVKILADLPATGKKSPVFALNGAKLVSLKNNETTTEWIVEALPHTNAIKARLTIFIGTNIIEFPLTIAPPVKGASQTETDFIAFLSDSGSANPKHDLNGDSKHDYLDDFIYTANYLAQKETIKKTTPLKK